MAANKAVIEGWIERAKEEGATHIVSVCDRFDYDDYPVFVMPGQDPNQVAYEYNNKSMQSVNEIIIVK